MATAAPLACRQRLAAFCAGVGAEALGCEKPPPPLPRWELVRLPGGRGHFRTTTPLRLTQQLLDAPSATPPELIAEPTILVEYAARHLPFAMAASIEVTGGGRVWTCWAGGEDGPAAYLLASFSDNNGERWADPVFVIDPQRAGLLPMGTRLGALWLDPTGRLWLFFHQCLGMFDGANANWAARCDDPDAAAPAWSAPIYIGFGASLNKPIVASNGDWLLPVSLWERLAITDSRSIYRPHPPCPQCCHVGTPATAGDVGGCAADESACNVARSGGTSTSPLPTGTAS